MSPIKTASEIEKMRAACKLASEILDQVTAVIVPGITTREIDLTAAQLMEDAGCRSAFLGYKNFPGNICVSLN
jgi:methionyl aminopeptidase